MENLESAKTPLEYTAEARPADMLQKFFSVFENKGWLNQSVRIKYHDRRYRVWCSDEKFIAYRINDNCGMSQGIPGWLVCIIVQAQIIEDSQMSDFASDEPSANDWLRCITKGDYELI